MERALEGMARVREIDLPTDRRQWIVHVSHENLLPARSMTLIQRLPLPAVHVLTARLAARLLLLRAGRRGAAVGRNPTGSGTMSRAAGMTRSTPRLSAREVRNLLPRIFAALRAADRITLGHLHRVEIHHKADGSEVTVADKAAERLLRRHLRAAWPHDAVLGEEYGGTLERVGRCWLLDPIDGTASYVLGLPMFGTLVSLLIDGEPVFGCIHLSALKETTYAARGLELLADARWRPCASRARRGPTGNLGCADRAHQRQRQRSCAPPRPWRLTNLALGRGGCGS